MKITPPNITPGPWAVIPGTRQVLAGTAPRRHCYQGFPIASPVKGIHTTDAKANAKAIAAMPQLLAALEFYANPENWKEQETGIGMAPSDADCDCGSKALQALTAAGYTITP